MQVVEYVSPGRQRVVKYIGSARTPAELGVLMGVAREFLRAYDQPGQGVLDLDVGVEHVVELVAEPGQDVLLNVGQRGPVTPVVAAPGRVVGAASRLLFDVIASVYDDLGFGALDDEVFRDLVIARVVEPTSLLDVERVLIDLGHTPTPYISLRRTLKRAQSGEYRDRLASLCFDHAVAHGDVSLVLYDITTLHWEAEKEDGLRKVGYSKERRVDPQILVGLLVDRRGFPLEIACFEGNKAEQLTLVTVIDMFKARHGIENMVIVADAGMLSAFNLARLDEAGYRFIVGSRATKAPLDLESHFRWHGTHFVDGQIIDTITPKTGRTSISDPATRAEPVWDPATHDGAWRAVWAYSQKRAARDNKTLTSQENRANDVIDGHKAARTPRFVKIDGDSRRLDTAALARARKVVGLKGYVTNMPATVMPAAEVIASYHDLWNVEQSFRMSKSDLAARPMFARKRDAIEAHLTIVFAALAISRTIQNRTGLTLRRVLRTLRPLRSATIAINGAIQTFPPDLNADQQALVDALVTHQSK